VARSLVCPITSTPLPFSPTHHTGVDHDALHAPPTTHTDEDFCFLVYTDTDEDFCFLGYTWRRRRRRRRGRRSFSPGVKIFATQVKN
jgi:hypothetical protein